MILRDLLPTTVPLRIQGPLDVEIACLAYDSRLVTPGSLFFALPGSKTDGAHFIDQAVTRGACAIVAPPDIIVAPHLPVIVCATPRVLLGLVADRFYKRPSARLTMVGVTGTSGKTTTTYLLESIWQAMGWQTGVIGTVNYRYRGQTLPAPFTTPEAVELHALLDRMATDGVSHLVMEVSSHALVQERVRGCHWDGAVFTNLGRDHLDFHRDMEEYFAAKTRLFTEALAMSEKRDRFAVINADDPWGARLLAKSLPARILTYGMQSDASVSVGTVEHSFHGMRGVLRIGDDDVPFTSRLIGALHLYNIMAAAATARASGVPTEVIVAGIANCSGAPGRMEAIAVGQPFDVLVDYAHKPDALEKMLRSVRPLTRNRVILVFGCGGDRDKGKRPLMGAVAGRLSDVVILTSDNPRTENPWDIMAQAEAGLIEAGIPKGDDPTQLATTQRGYVALHDRRAAIHAALAAAQAGDVVVIAGKGHEDYQIVGTTKHHFDDREEVLDRVQVTGNRLQGKAGDEEKM